MKPRMQDVEQHTGQEQFKTLQAAEAEESDRFTKPRPWETLSDGPFTVRPSAFGAALILAATS